LQSLKSLNGGYRGLFEQSDEEDADEPKPSKGGFARYGWVTAITTIVDKLNYTPDQVYNMHVFEFLHWCSYFKAENEYIKAETERMKIQNGIRR